MSSVPANFRTLDPAEIVQTLHRLHQRIAERFPNSGLAAVCFDLAALAETTQRKAERIAAPNLALRAIVFAVIAGGIGALIYLARLIRLQIGEAEILTFFQGVEAAMNIVVLTGALLYFLFSLEARLKRRQALRDLHELRSLAHVIDMHQLTKDPSAILAQGPSTAASPKRGMSRFELTRYLDYCAEMQAMTGKLAALYAQNLPDPTVIDAVNDIESLTTNLGRKIWQKITILESYEIATGGRGAQVKT